jgi:PBP1b-binding outer membrane lipoprotein LpoB
MKNRLLMPILAAFAALLFASCTSAPAPRSAPASSAPAASASGKNSVAATAPANGVSLDAALQQAAEAVKAKVPDGEKIAVVKFNTKLSAGDVDNKNVSDYLFNEFCDDLVDAGAVVVDRDNINLIKKEQKFQSSGLVDQATAVEIGKLLGAHSSVQGELINLGNTLRLRVSSINVQTGRQEVGVHKNIIKDANFEQMVEALNGNSTVTKDAAY